MPTAIDHPAKSALGVGGSACTMVDLLTQLGGRKERYLPVLVCIAASLALHVLAGGASLFEPAASSRAVGAPVATTAELSAESELVELDQLESEPVADSVRAGAEGAQGNLAPEEPAPAEPPRAEPTAATEPAAAPPIAEPAPTEPPAAQPIAKRAPPEPAAAPSEPRNDAPSPLAPSSRPPTSARPAASAPPRASASAAAPGAASATSPGSGGTDGPEGPGDGGGFERPRAPNAAARFTKELAAYAAPVVAWRELALGPAGELRLQIELDEEGRIVTLERLCFAPATPPEPLGESIRRSLRALRMPLAPPGSERAGAGRFELRIRANIDHVEVEATPGGDYRLESHYAGSRGHAAFVLESGRRVRFELELSAGELGACP